MQTRTYTTAMPEGAKVCTGDLVYDYYSMEPVRIGHDLGEGWFETYLPSSPANSPIRSSAGMLNGERICTMEYAKRRGFKGA